MNRHGTMKLPRRFVEDHIERDLPTPEIWRWTKTHVIVTPCGEGFDDLVADARFYADEWGPDTPELRRAAKAMLRAVEKWTQIADGGDT